MALLARASNWPCWLGPLIGFVKLGPLIGFVKPDSRFSNTGIPRSSGLKGLGEKFNFGVLPRGLGLDSSFTVKLTKSKKLDDTVTKDDLDETKVEIVKRAEPKENERKEEPEQTILEFVENLLIKLMEDALTSMRK